VINILAIEGWSMEVNNDNVVIISSISNLQQLRLDNLNALQNNNLISNKKEEV